MPATEPLVDEGLDVPSTEVAAEDLSVRAPALRLEERLAPWRERFRRVASVASVVLALGGSAIGGREAHRWITHTPRFGARDIEIVGLTRTTRDEVLTAAHLATGTNVLGFDTRHAERDIAELPWIEQVHVTRRLPGSVRIEVSERTASAVVSAGGLYLTTADGTLFKRVAAGDPDDLPVITGIERADFERDPDLARESVRDALALLADFDGSSLSGRIHVDEVHRDATGDLSMVLTESGTYVWLGRGPYRAKMARLSVILTELSAQRITAAEIHLESDRHPERATVRVPVPAEAFAQLPAAVPCENVMAQVRAHDHDSVAASVDEAPQVVHVRRHRRHSGH